jgi:hypothetical protein
MSDQIINRSEHSQIFKLLPGVDCLDLFDFSLGSPDAQFAGKGCGGDCRILYRKGRPAARLGSCRVQNDIFWQNELDEMQFEQMSVDMFYYASNTKCEFIRMMETLDKLKKHYFERPETNRSRFIVLIRKKPVIWHAADGYCTIRYASKKIIEVENVRELPARIEREKPFTFFIFDGEDFYYNRIDEELILMPEDIEDYGSKTNDFTGKNTSD